MGNAAPPEVNAPPRLFDQLRDCIRMRHYSIRTERTYAHWVRRFILFHGKRHPREMGAAEVSSFLSALATEGNVAASTQNQALSALLFLYKQVLAVDLPWLHEVSRAKKSRRLPTVLTQAEVRALLAHIEGTHGLMARDDLRHGHAAHGMRPPACEGCRPRASRSHRAPGQARGREPARSLSFERVSTLSD